MSRFVSELLYQYTGQVQSVFLGVGPLGGAIWGQAQAQAHSEEEY
jgi:hypothetical protein